MEIFYSCKPVTKSPDPSRPDLNKREQAELEIEADSFLGGVNCLSSIFGALVRQTAAISASSDDNVRQLVAARVMIDDRVCHV
jgi:hypothetical protein